MCACTALQNLRMCGDVEYRLKPIERPSLEAPGSSFPQGSIDMWLEIIPKETRLPPEIFPKLARPEVMPFEVRIVVWRCSPVSRFASAMGNMHGLTGK